ncbi:MAG: hypothetical protein M4579_001076 [Chaenotheca gracillima]|nr:MAG: hypothetical protein M4579_001076 [Chaenotheca gracillima]
MSYDQYRQDVDGPRGHRTTHRQYDRPRGQYAETTYVERRETPRSSRQLDLVRRPREDSDISVEEIQREFPPPGADYDRRRGRARSMDRSGYDNYGYADPRYADSDLYDERDARPRRRDDKHGRGRSMSRGQELAAAAAGAGLLVGGKELWDRNQAKNNGGRRRSRSRVQTAALGVAGAVAGDIAAKQYAKSRAKSRGRGEDDDPYGRPKPQRRKSIADIGEAALGALGLGAATGGGRGRDRDDRHRSHRGRGSSSSSYDSQSRSRSQGRKTQAARAALTAAAAEAWRGRKDPGGWLEPEKARRIITAAAGAGGIDALVDRNPDKHSKRHTAEGAIGGLLLNRLVNGSRADSRARSMSRSRSRGGGGRQRSRSRGGSALKDLGVAGLAAGAAKKFLDSRNDRSRSRGRDRRYSSSSSGSYSPRPRKQARSRSRSVINRGLSRLGLRSPSPDDRMARKNDPYSQSRSMPRGGGRARSEGGKSTSDSDSGSEFELEEEEKNRRKMKGKEILTAGLATVATIHAGHGIYQSMEARDARTKAVLEGKMTQEESKTLARKGYFQDAAAVGLAALGVKGAMSEWKSAAGERKEFHEMHEKVKRHREIAQRREMKRSRGGMSRANSHRNSAPNLNNAYQNGPVYADGNPYAAGGQQPYDNRRY